jgi:hypothetical protein
MRRYRTFFPGFWTSPDIVDLPCDTKLLAAYLLTSPHANMIGCYRLPNAYVVEDLRMGSETVSEGFRNLCGKGFITHDSPLSWVLINKFLKWNPIENPNQGIAASKLVGEVPRNSSAYAPLLGMLRENSRNFPAGFIDGLETLREPFRNLELEQEQEQEPEDDSDESSSGDSETTKKKKRSSAEDIEKIRLAYPLKKAPGAARKAIGKAIERLAARGESDPVAFLIARIEAMPAAREREAARNNGFAPSYPYPSTWMNKECYDEEGLQPVKNCVLPDGKPCTAAELEAQTGWKVIRGEL